MAEIVQANLPQHTNPVILTSYQPKVQKRPGTIAEWVEFVNRLAQLSEDLSRDARVMIAKRREIAESKPGSINQRQAERDFAAVLKRGTEHCQYLANAFLATGMPRDHLENHLEQCGTERDHRPEYEIALLYSKLMGIPFREVHISVKEDPAGGEPTTERLEEDKTFIWAREIRAGQVDDFYRTIGHFHEVIPALAGKFRRGEVRM